MRNCEKQVSETWLGKQDEGYQVKNNLFLRAGQRLQQKCIRDAVSFVGRRGFHLVSI